MDGLNKDLEETIANAMAYELTKNMFMKDANAKKMIEIAKRYGLEEKAAIFMIMELSQVEED
ncbi:hypothetical protein RSA37_11685 [Mammaliicoccus sciuri]|uniref:hypothetical protein n=1 Tax=Mammaliicoccus sciuri TaxID=1296 RepID=UPI00073466D7|nr:hypothetical protein [Mammaliicoccus sciuri]KTT82694.1 hypothetical protein NS1R_11945 [Mammaliicoccus sciuri]KTT88249.1 hypothetical protein NS112_09545 [Mammaliicoccus sciuri]KTT89792.1 hypothetical protein NS36R_08070 [Mammaliicoccus sciuri]KTT94184.1 hypothetical protein NS44R_08485 [Mammaliicoccus sciuri]KTW10710.1 hypothetical protein RSA37_11685 [Mammaliicoccus sciuri]